MCYWLVIALGFCFVMVKCVDRQASLVVLPPLVLGYDELYEDNITGKPAARHDNNFEGNSHVEIGNTEQEGVIAEGNENSLEKAKRDGMGEQEDNEGDTVSYANPEIQGKNRDYRNIDEGNNQDENKEINIDEEHYSGTKAENQGRIDRRAKTSYKEANDYEDIKVRKQKDLYADFYAKKEAHKQQGSFERAFVRVALKQGIPKDIVMEKLAEIKQKSQRIVDRKRKKKQKDSNHYGGLLDMIERDDHTERKSGERIMPKGFTTYFKPRIIQKSSKIVKDGQYGHLVQLEMGHIILPKKVVKSVSHART